MTKSLVDVLRLWVADREGIDPGRVEAVSLNEYEGFGGSDVTPPEAWELAVRYTIEGGTGRHVEIRPGAVGAFIERLVTLANG